MKSSLIESQMDLTLEILGESWNQGQELNGTLTLKNKTAQLQKPNFQKLLIAYIDIKKFKNLVDNFYKEVATIDLGAVELGPMQTITLPWSFKLEENFFITDKKNSPYILWGDLSKKIPASLMLNINPHQSLLKIIEVWSIFFRFVCKEILSNKDQTLEIKFAPPTSREYATVEFIKLKMKRHNADLSISASASLKSIVADTTGMKLQKSEKFHEVVWKEKQYQLMPGHLHQEFVQQGIQSILQGLLKKS